MFYPKCDNLTLHLTTGTGNGEWVGDRCFVLLEARVFLARYGKRNWMRWKWKHVMKLKE